MRMKFRCPVCSGPGVYNLIARAQHCECEACGWFFSVPSLALAFELRLVEPFQCYAGGAHLAKRDVACGACDVEFEVYERKPMRKAPRARANTLRAFIELFFHVAPTNPREVV